MIIVGACILLTVEIQWFPQGQVIQKSCSELEIPCCRCTVKKNLMALFNAELSEPLFE